MKLSKSLLAISTVVVSAWCTQVISQEMQKAPTFNPAELFTCNYLEGKDRGDLDKVVEHWNEWMDANNAAPYSAWVLTPAFFGAEIDFDLVWMGAWPTNADMGNGLQLWQDKGSKVNAEFFEVFSCNQHVSMAVMPLQEPVKFTDSSLVRFMDCSVAEDKSITDAMQANRKFHKYMNASGADTNAWIFFPGMGSGNADFDYKLVLANPDYPSLTKDAEILTNGGGWKEAGKTLDGTTNCDSPRLYKADMVRSGLTE